MNSTVVLGIYLAGVLVYVLSEVTDVQRGRSEWHGPATVFVALIWPLWAPIVGAFWLLVAVVTITEAIRR